MGNRESVRYSPDLMELTSGQRDKAWIKTWLLLGERK